MQSRAPIFADGVRAGSEALEKVRKAFAGNKSTHAPVKSAREKRRDEKASAALVPPLLFALSSTIAARLSRKLLYL